MIEFESMQGLFEILKVDKIPYKHWSEYNEWENGKLLAQCGFGYKMAC
jgi:hypothetical protein